MARILEPTVDQQAAMWDDVRDEFPGDELMQEIHYIRLLQHHRTQGMTPAELVRYYNERGDKLTRATDTPPRTSFGTNR